MYKKKLLLMSLLIGLPLVYGSDKEVELKEEFILENHQENLEIVDRFKEKKLEESKSYLNTFNKKTIGKKKALSSENIADEESLTDLMIARKFFFEKNQEWDKKLKFELDEKLKENKQEDEQLKNQLNEKNKKIIEINKPVQNLSGLQTPLGHS